MKINKEYIRLAQEIMLWWENAQFMTGVNCDGIEYNVFDDDPYFVRLAEKLLSITKCEYCGYIKGEHSKNCPMQILQWHQCNLDLQSDILSAQIKALTAE
jgi:hypothetical protein